MGIELNYTNQRIVTALRNTDSKGGVKIISKALDNGDLTAEETNVADLFELVMLERCIEQKTLHLKQLKQDVEDLRNRLNVR